MVTDGEKTDMESPLKLLNLNIYYQLEFGPFLRKKNWPGKVLGNDIFQGTYHL